MRIGLSIADSTVAGGSACLGPELARVARAADQLGFCALTVMDHYFQRSNHQVSPDTDLNITHRI